MKTEKHRKQKGSVHLTVVSVLSIMIIFMTCALAMAAASNKRSRKTYSSSQSSYTARTAIDSILAAIGTDKDFSKSVRALKNKGNKMDILVDVNDPSMGRIENATIENIGTKVLYDSVKGQWVERNLFAINADVTIGGETTSITSKILQDPPATDSGKGQGGAAFLTYGDMTAIQKVLGFGGTYIGMGTWKDESGKKYEWNDMSGNGLKYYYWKPVGGDYTQPDYFTSLKEKQYRTGKEYGITNASFFEAPWVVNGTFKTATKLGVVYTYQDTGIYNNGAEIWGDLNLGSNTCDFTVRGTDKLANYLGVHGYDFMSMPYFYIDGTLITNSDVQLKFGHPDLPLNIFMGTLNDTANAMREYYGDIYLMDSGASNKLAVNNGTKLYNWASSTVTKSKSVSSVGGSIYCNGDLELASNGLEIGGSIIVEGDLTITGNADVTIGGDIAVGGNFYYNSDSKFTVGGNIYTNDPGKSIAGGKKFDDEHFEEKTIEETLTRIYNAYWQENPYYGDTQRSLWIYADKLSAAQSECGVSGLNFGGKHVNPDYVVSKEWVSDDAIAKAAAETKKESRTAYINKDTGDEVEKDACYVPAGDITTVDISEYKDAHDNRVYPQYATRDVLIGAERFLYVKGVADRVVKYGEIPDANRAAMEASTYTGTYNPDASTTPASDYTVSSDITLTGTIGGRVIVKPPLDTDIYIRLKDVEFYCQEDKATSKVTDNSSYIDIDESESGTGHAYFVYDGNVISNYDFNSDLANTRLVKTVYDWMSEFNFGDVPKENTGHEGTVYSNDSSLVGKKYTTYEVEYNGDGTIKSKVAKEETIKNISELSKDPSTGKYLITANTTFVGTKLSNSSNDIIVKAPSTGDVWVTFDSTVDDKKCSMEGSASVIVDDTDTSGTGNVNIYLKGQLTFDGNGMCGIISKYVKDTIDAGNKLNIVSKRDSATYKKIVNKLKCTTTEDDPKEGTNGNDMYPTIGQLRTYLYADKGARLTLYNQPMVMAYVKAPETLTVDIGNPKDNQTLLDSIYYDGMPLTKLKDASYLKEGVSPRIGFIGMLNVLEVTNDAKNDWFLLYDAPGSGDDSAPSGDPDAEGFHRYAAVEYVAYAR